MKSVFESRPVLIRHEVHNQSAFSNLLHQSFGVSTVRNEIWRRI